MSTAVLTPPGFRGGAGRQPSPTGVFPEAAAGLDHPRLLPGADPAAVRAGRGQPHPREPVAHRLGLRAAPRHNAFCAHIEYILAKFQPPLLQQHLDEPDAVFPHPGRDLCLLRPLPRPANSRPSPGLRYDPTPGDSLVGFPALLPAKLRRSAALQGPLALYFPGVGAQGGTLLFLRADRVANVHVPLRGPVRWDQGADPVGVDVCRRHAAGGVVRLCPGVAPGERPVRPVRALRLFPAAICLGSPGRLQQLALPVLPGDALRRIPCHHGAALLPHGPAPAAAPTRSSGACGKTRSSSTCWC